MSELLDQAKLTRGFVSPNLTISAWSDVESYFNDLLNREINSVNALELWMKNRSELDAVLEEELAWRYIKMNCNTEDAGLAESFNLFVSEIEPKAHTLSNELDKKFTNNPFFENLDKQKYFILVRNTKNSLELFREANVELHAQLQQESQEYGVICSKQMIEHDGKELTLQQAAVYLKELNRDVRQSVYLKLSDRRLQDAEALNSLLDKLIAKRHTIAQNAGYSSYVEYRFKELGRFDYTQDDCNDFHTSVQKFVLPLVKQLQEQRMLKLGLDELRPWDTEVDTDNQAPLKPFNDSEDLLQKAITCFDEIDSQFGEYLRIMKRNGHFDLESRKGKAPGGFNYPLYESNAPFIYMNAAGTLRDVETMVHEGGHAIHSFLSAELELVDFKGLPSEVAELASMSMELISMEHWHHYFTNEAELKRAKRNQLEGIIAILPWIMIVDAFQNHLYTHIGESFEERTVAWNKILKDFSDSIVNWNGLEQFRNISWQKQLHIFEVPFYYIEYGISQLGAISIWKNYKQNPKETIVKYKQALALGYTVSIKEIYQVAGIRFDFSSEYISELLTFVSAELQGLE